MKRPASERITDPARRRRYAQPADPARRKRLKHPTDPARRKRFALRKAPR